MLVYFPRIGGMAAADEPLDGNVVVMVEFMSLTAKLNGCCSKQIHKVNWMSKSL